MSIVVSLICLGPSFKKISHQFLLHGSLQPTNLEKNLKPCIPDDNKKHAKSPSVQRVKPGFCSLFVYLDPNCLTLTQPIIQFAELSFFLQSLEPLVNTITDLSTENTCVYCCYEERTTGDKPRLQKTFFKVHTCY